MTWRRGLPWLPPAVLTELQPVRADHKSCLRERGAVYSNFSEDYVGCGPPACPTWTQAMFWASLCSEAVTNDFSLKTGQLSQEPLSLSPDLPKPNEKSLLRPLPGSEAEVTEVFALTTIWGVRIS